VQCVRRHVGSRTAFLTRPAGLLAVILVSALFAHPAMAQPACVVTDNGSGTVNLPPLGCGYVSPIDLHRMINGLPPGTTINVGAQHFEFFNIVRTPSPLGGEDETFDSSLSLNLQGTGGLVYNRFVTMPAQCETHTAPRSPGDPIQSFDTDMRRIQGQIIGDPDFDLLRITAGTAFGMPSPGHTTLTRTPSGTWNVDSFFDIEYRIDFVGHMPGPLGGMSGSTTATIRMHTGQPAMEPLPCMAADDGSGTVKLPPAGCGYVSPMDLHRMIDGLPPGTTIEIDPKHNRFFNIVTMPGGGLGGDKETFDSTLEIKMMGTGGLAYTRMLAMPVQSETHTGPRMLGAPMQSFDTDMFMLQGQMIGDPDFDLLRITGGTGFGMPSPGHTTLTRLPSTNWTVDSFFDITYRIDFVGQTPGPFSGMSGSTTGTIRMTTGQPQLPCPPIPAGMDSFPSTGKVILEYPIGSAPQVVRLSSAGLPDAMVQRGPQVGNEIQTEMLSMNLQGFIPGSGAVMIRESAILPSTGKITMVNNGDPNDPNGCGFAEGDSFFDIFFDVEVTGTGQHLVNVEPARVGAKIKELPPKDTSYENPFVNPIFLYDPNNPPPVGGPVGRLLYEVHDSDPNFPPPDNDCFDTILQADLQLFSPPFPVPYMAPLSAQGPTLVRRTGPYLPPTLLETIDTEILSMNLRGFDPMLGNFEIRTNPAAGAQSLGNAQENPGPGTYPADSFFDVFVAIDSLPGGTMQAQTKPPNPNHIQAQLSTVPPGSGTVYQEPPSDVARLWDPAGTTVIGQLSNVQHQLGGYRSWEPPPPPDDDCFDSWITLKITLYDPYFPGGCMETLMLPGVFRILRSNPIVLADGRDLIDNIMACAVLTSPGSGLCGGAVTARLSPNTASAGSAQSIAPNENFPMDSFFDVFVELDTSIGTLHTLSPAHMSTGVNHMPPDPGEIYYGPGTVIPLYAGPIQVGEILEVSHEIHGPAVCPCECSPDIDLRTSGNATCGITGQGAGVQFDVVKGQIGPALGSPGFLSAICLQNNGPADCTDPMNPAPGRAFWYLSRDAWEPNGPGGFVGTYNNPWSPSQVGNRDAALGSTCP